MKEKGITVEQARQNVIYQWKEIANAYITKFDATINNESHNRNTRVMVSIPTEHYPCVSYVEEHYKVAGFEVIRIPSESEDSTDINISW